MGRSYSCVVLDNFVWGAGHDKGLFETGHLGSRDQAEQTIDPLNEIKDNMLEELRITETLN